MSRDGSYYRREISTLDDLSNNTHWNKSGNNIYNKNLTGNVGIDIINPVYTLDISGDLHISKRLYDNLNTSGNIGQVLTTTGLGFRWTDVSSAGVASYWSASGPNIYNNVAVNTGIAISSPLYTLDVSGTTRISGNVGIGMAPSSYKLDVSGSFKSKTIVDISNSSGLSGETLISIGNGNGYKWSTPIYGSFSSDISQNINISGGLGYPTAITYNRAEISHLCDFSGSRIYVRQSGVFKFSYSIQMVQTNNQSHKVYIYLKQNGVILDRTASTIMLLKDSEIFPFCEYILPLNKDDYIEVVFYSDGTTVKAVYLLNSTNVPPYFPSSPSIISNIYSLVTYP